MKHTFFVGTYTRWNPNEEHRKEGIFVYQIDTETGKCSRLSAAESGPNPSFLALHPNKRFLYSVNEQPQGGVSAFAIGPESGGLTRLNGQPTNGADPCYLSIDPAGHWLLTANYSGGSLAVHPILPDGQLGPLAEHIQHVGSGPNHERQEKAHAHSIRFDPSGRFILAADLGLDQVLIYRMDPQAGKLTLHNQVAMEPGAGPRHFDFHANGRFLYVVNELANSIVACIWDAQTGTITPFQSLPTLPADFSGESTVADVHIHPNGNYVYVSNRGHNSLAAYAIDPAIGSLTHVGQISTGGEWPRNFAFDPSGRFLLAANQFSDNVVSFSVDAENGLLTPTGDEAAVPYPVCVRFLE
jgi:6-phosphogluconolactonase